MRDISTFKQRLVIEYHDVFDHRQAFVFLACAENTKNKLFLAHQNF